MANFKVTDENRSLVRTMFHACTTLEPTDDEQLNKFLGLLDELTDREEAVLLYRYGLMDGKCYTLAELGSKFGVTGERIRQIEIKAIRKLRHPARSKALFEQPVEKESLAVDLNTPIKETRLSIRTINCLTRAGINTVGDLRKVSFEDLIHAKNLGRKSLKEILTFLLNTL